MPFISVKTNTEISKEKEVNLKVKLGKAIGILPGKSESYLMLEFEDNRRLYFKGKNDQPIAYVEVKCFGKGSGVNYNKLTAEITNILSSELDIQPGNSYIKYEETEYWGYNGANF